MNPVEDNRPAPLAPTRRSVTVGSSVQVFVRVFGLLSGAIVVAVQARTLSVTDFGYLSTILLINGMAISLADLGLLNTAVQRMSRSPEARHAIVSALLMCRFALGIVLTLGSVLASLFLFSTSEAQVAAIVIVAGIPLSSLSAIQSLPMAGLRLLPQNVLLFVQSFIWTLVVLVLGAVHAGLLGFAVGFLASAVVQSGITLLLCGRGYRFRLSEARREAPPLIRRAIPLGLGALGVTAYYRLTGLVLFSVAGAAASANYSAAFRIVDVLQVLPSTVVGPLIPLLTTAFSTGRRARAEAVWSLSFRLMLSVATLAACGMAVLAPQIIELLYGQKYDDAIGLLRIVAFAFIPICMGWLSTSAVTAAGAVRWYALVTIVGAVLSVGCALVFVPQFGATASAWVTVATESVVVIALGAIVHYKTGLRVSPSIVIRVALAAGVMSVVVLALGWPSLGLLASLPARVAVGIAVGIGSLLLLRVLTVGDIRNVMSRRSAHE